MTKAVVGKGGVWWVENVGRSGWKGRLVVGMECSRWKDMEMSEHNQGKIENGKGRACFIKDGGN